jgi:transcriptional regulator with XRE-family HTH domain
MRKLPSGESGVHLLATRIGKRLTVIRRSRGISRRDLATTLELPTESIEAYEKGTRLPRTYTLYELAQALSISTAFLLDNSPPQESGLDKQSVQLIKRLAKLPEHERSLLFNLIKACISAFGMLTSIRSRS